MIRAFLSHSSDDKGHYVEKVAEWLGKENIHYDELTFEEGEKALDEILKALNKTALFVLFISDNALNSEWVIKEISEAKERLDSSLLDKIYPIIIDERISYDDERIPDWLRDNYNIKPVLRPQVAARRIHTKLREISWSIHPELKKRQSMFIGRTDKLKEFEERIHNFDLKKPLAIIASGISGVGRRTFLLNALHKTHISDSLHKPSAIVLDRDVSIEDFILKLNDLGIVELGDDVLSLTSKTIDQKIAIVHKVMKASYRAKELIYVVDDGCLVNYKREMSDWFFRTIDTYVDGNFPIFCIASKYKVLFKNRPRSDKFFFVELNELNPSERKQLFTHLLTLYKVDIGKTNFIDINNLLFGFPDQVMYAVDLLRTDQISSVIDKLPLIAEYNTDKASTLLSQYQDDEKILDFIRLLAQFEVISLDFIFSIVDEKEYYQVLERLASESIVERIGIESEIIRLNDIIRDYIKRNRLYVDKGLTDKIKRQVSIITSSDDLFELDSSEYIFALKESLKEGNNIDEKYLIPSHYLRCMRDLYYNRGNLNRIIELADIILQKEATLDDGVIQDVRYYLCLALAKKKDNRLVNEVQNIKGPEHSFLLGFYYRLTNRYKDALDRFNKIIDEPYVGSRAKREIVQVYVQLEEYDKALDYAHKNYEENRGNQFHTQAYFSCLINSESPENYKDILESLIKNLRGIDSEQSVEMAEIAEALFEAKVNNNEQVATDKINDCVNKYPDNHYPVLAQCDIALRFKNINYLETGLSELDRLNSIKHFSSRTLNTYKASLIALRDKDLDGALRLIQKDLDRYPSESKHRVISRMTEYSRC